MGTSWDDRETTRADRRSADRPAVAMGSYHGGMRRGTPKKENRPGEGGFKGSGCEHGEELCQAESGEDADRVSRGQGGRFSGRPPANGELHELDAARDRGEDRAEDQERRKVRGEDEGQHA